MKAKQIYKKLKEIVDKIHSHDEQMVAIVEWIESEFDPKVRMKKCHTQDKFKNFNNIDHDFQI